MQKVVLELVQITRNNNIYSDKVYIPVFWACILGSKNLFYLVINIQPGKIDRNSHYSASDTSIALSPNKSSSRSSAMNLKSDLTSQVLLKAEKSR